MQFGRAMDEKRNEKIRTVISTCQFFFPFQVMRFLSTEGPEFLFFLSFFLFFFSFLPMKADCPDCGMRRVRVFFFLRQPIRESLGQEGQMHNESKEVKDREGHHQIVAAFLMVGRTVHTATQSDDWLEVR